MIRVLLLIFLFKVSVYGQEKQRIAGKVVDEDLKALRGVSVSIPETQQSTSTNEDGLFRISLPKFPPQEITIRLSMVGKQTIEKVVTVKRLPRERTVIILKELNLSLAQIKINAVRTHKSNSNSSIIIDRENILQTPSLSLADILNELPGKKIQAPSLQGPQQLTLRANVNGDHALSNANGIALIIDGNRLNNDANMQFNPLSNTGFSGSQISGKYGVGASKSSQPDNVFGGFDLRQIPVENIESIEIISGVASAKYGDLTDGAVIVNRQAGEGPFYIRSQFRNGTSQFSVNKGFKVSNRSAINAGINLTNSNDDPRDKIKSYRRLSLSLMHSLDFGRKDKFKNTLSFDVSRNLDGVRVDRDDRDSSQIKTINNGYSVTNRFAWTLNSSFLKRVSWGASLNFSEQESYKGTLVNNAPFAYINSTTPGFYEGTYTNGNYYFENWIKGKPLTASSNLDLTAGYDLANLSHTLSFGINYSYFKNNGEGRIVDPARPLTATGYTGVYRDYDFTRIQGQTNIGAYIEDTFEQQLFKKPLRWSIGIRGDSQNGFTSFSPRISNHYRLAKNWSLSLGFGYGYRAPSLAVRFPGPSYQDFTLVNYFPNIPAENYYLAYTDVFYPDNSKVRPSRSVSYEINLGNNGKKLSWSLSAYHKRNKDGITTQTRDILVTLPQYEVIRNPGAKPTLIKKGSKEVFWSAYSAGNGLASSNNGLELWLTSSKIEALQTSFNISSSVSESRSFSDLLLRESENNWIEQAPNDDYAVVAYYVKGKSRSIQASSRFTANTHIQPLSLMLRFTAEAFWYNRTFTDEASNYPSAYISRGGEYVTIETLDPENLNYKHLIKNRNVVNDLNRQPIPYYNFHFSVSKEIKKKLRFSFNAYNVFNYQPVYYLQNSNSTITFNGPPSFGAEISFKF